MNTFNRLTIVVLASTEQSALIETLQQLADCCEAEDIEEIIIFLLSSECPSAAVARSIQKQNPFPFKIRIGIQTTPGLKYAVHESPRLVHSSHFLIIGSDLEMSPLSVPVMIETSKKHPKAIVCASKFKKDSYRKNYGKLHYLCNRAVNFTVEQILHIKGTELIATFQIYPTDLFLKMHFNNPKRTFYQFTIRPLTRGTEYIEISTNYIKRTEGDSNFNLMRYIDLAVNFLSTAVLERKIIKLQKKNKS